MMRKTSNIQKIAIIAMMLALDVVMSHFINLPLLHMGLGFLPLAIVAMMYGPWYAGFVGAAADVIGWAIFSGNYPYFYGFTITGLLTGILFGLFLYKRRGWLSIVVLSVITCLVFSLCLDSFWLMVLYGKLSLLKSLPTIMSDKWFAPFIVQRCFKLMMIPIMIVLIYPMQKLLQKMGRLPEKN